MVALLYFSLTRNPRILPSALLDKAAPAFALQTLEGERVSLDELRGQPVLLNFWSTWCGPCVAEHRLIQQVQQIYALRGVHFYSILYEDTVEKAHEFIKQYGPAAPILLDPDLRTAIDYGVAGVPETFFIDTEGRVVFKHVGVLTPQLIHEKLAQLIEASEKP